MEMTNVSRCFSSNKYNDHALSSVSQRIINGLTGNKAFATPDPPLATIQTAQNNFLAAVAKAIDGSRQDTADKKAKREILEDLLKKEADYVQRISGGVESLILSAGFDIYKTAEPVGPLPIPSNFKVQVGPNRGAVQLSCDAVSKADFYEFEFTESPATVVSVWRKKTCTKKQLLLEGLESGKEYTFRVAAAGANPSRQWTGELSSFVL